MQRVTENGKRQLTIKEKIFIKEMVKTKGNKTESAIRAFNTKKRYNAMQIGKRVVKRPVVKQALEEAFKHSGITIDYLLDKEKEIIEQGIANGKPTMSDARLSIQNMHKLLNSYPNNVQKKMSVNLREDVTQKDTSLILEELKKLNSATSEILEDLK